VGECSAMSSVFVYVLRHNNADPKQLTGMACINPSGCTPHTLKRWSLAICS